MGENTVVIGFCYPSGISLEERLKCGLLSECAASKLCRELLHLRYQLEEMLHFWRILTPSMIFINEEDALVSVCPLGNLLSWSGFYDFAMKHVAKSQLAPELEEYLCGSDSSEPASTDCTDLYAIAALILEATAGIAPHTYRNTPGVGISQLSKEANDFLLRALFENCSLRLDIENAVEHAWLRGEMHMRNVCHN